MTLRTIQIEVYRGSLLDIDNMSVDELVGLAQMIQAKCPPQHRADSKVEVDLDSDWGARISVVYERPETDEDRRARREAEERQKREAEASLHKREYEEYQRLKAKYEGKTK